ncbi:Transposase InsO and inactivated derivatives [Nakamurella panacisegetis]|uniref:Transposase InsO and inactivated derivatives n=1 Tax=Nakamurella panacisegetis TaxID=1090615 RepID=A0A1H0REQ6_9ACTN|nr:DDE-type integrase/transposase/recombinase [Nakamurella panacisegetis]SDP28102.1 Transposase InsO and inactivated derivatives [Nakamurella panacisegetis]
MTPEQIISHRRTQVLVQAGKVGVAEACRRAGVSRQSYYRWASRASKYGTAALLPKTRRPPVMPNAMTAQEVSTVLAVAIANPTLGARQLLRHLANQDVQRSASGVQKVLHRHQLGARRQRVAALAWITAAEHGQVTDAALQGPFGFCLAAARPGMNVALDSFYVGTLKGVGTIWQFTTIDICTRWSIASLIVGDKTAAGAATFLDHLIVEFDRIGVPVTGVLTDNGPEFTGRDFRDHAADLGVTHHRIPPRSPNHNAVCERVQGTLLHEFYRPFFHRARIDRVADLDAGLQRALHDYNHHRPNHGAYMKGQTPRQMLNEKSAAK